MTRQAQQIAEQEETWTLPKDSTNVTGRRLGGKIEYVTVVYAPDMKALDEKIKLECSKKLFICIGGPRKEKREYTRPDIKWTYTKNGRGSYYYCAGLYWLKEHAPQVIKREMVLVNGDSDDFDACDSCGHAVSGKMYLLVSKKGQCINAFCGACASNPKEARKCIPKRPDDMFHDKTVQRTVDDLFFIKTAAKC